MTMTMTQDQIDGLSERGLIGPRVYESLTDSLNRGIGLSFTDIEQFIIMPEEEKEPMTPGEKITGAADLGLNMAGGALGAVASGYAGLVSILDKQFQDGSISAKDWDIVGKRIEGTQEQIGSYIGISEEGQRVAEYLGKFLGPAGEFLSEYIGKPIQQGIVDPIGEKYGWKAGATAQTVKEFTPEVLGYILGPVFKATGLKKGISFKKAMKDVDTSVLYDSAGKIKPEMRRVLEDAGITPAMIDDVLPETLPTEAVDKAVKSMIGSSDSTSRIPGRMSGAERAAELTRPSEKRIRTAAAMGVNAPLEVLTTNPAVKAALQSLRDIPDSRLSRDMKKYQEGLMKYSDDLVRRADGQLDQSRMADDFKTSATAHLKNVNEHAKELYKQVDETIPARHRVTGTRALDVLNERIRKGGGDITVLNDQEREILKALEPVWSKILERDVPPTYFRIDLIRKKLHNGEYNKVSADLTEDLNKAISADQIEATELFDQLHDTDISKVYQEAQKVRKHAYDMDENFTALFGADLKKPITEVARKAIDDLAKGKPGKFDDMLGKIPKNFAEATLGPNFQRQYVATALADVFETVDGEFDFKSFNKLMGGLKRNKVSYEKMQAAVGEDTMRRLENLHSMTSAKGSRLFTKATGEQTAKRFNAQQNVMLKLYGGGALLLSNPKMFMLGVIGSKMFKQNVNRAATADKLFSNPKFKDSIKTYTLSPDSPRAQKRLDKTVRRLKEWHDWKNTLGPKQKRQLAAIGFVEFLKSEIPEEETKNGPES